MYKLECPKEALKIVGILELHNESQNPPDTQGNVVHEMHEPTPELYRANNNAILPIKHEHVGIYV